MTQIEVFNKEFKGRLKENMAKYWTDRKIAYLALSFMLLSSFVFLLLGGVMALLAGYGGYHLEESYYEAYTDTAPFEWTFLYIVAHGAYVLWGPWLFFYVGTTGLLAVMWAGGEWARKQEKRKEDLDEL